MPQYTHTEDDGRARKHGEHAPVGVSRSQETPATEEETRLQPGHPNASLIWFWAAIVALSIGLIFLARAYL